MGGQNRWRLFILGAATAVALWQAPVHGAVIGIDARNGFDASGVLGTGSRFDTLRATITGAGHTLVTLTSFLAADLAGLDSVILSQPYGSPYTAAERAAIHGFVTGNVVLFSDTSMFSDAGAGSDRSIAFGSNTLLLQNATSFITSTGGGAMFLADNGSGFDPANMNALVAPYGVVYSDTPTEGAGHTVTAFNAHPVTAGLTQVGVDFQLRLISISGPAVDLTTNGGADNVVAAVGSLQQPVPEPATLAIWGLGTLGAAIAACRKRKPRA
jgi:hypothetical protein